MHNIRSRIASDIPFQFPDAYREDGELFVEFTKQYYEFLDDRIQRDNFTIRDIDTTYDSFLKYFKNKFLEGMPYEGVVDTRFIIKHIQDIYSSKGTEESLRIFFRMFFDEEIDIFYPSTGILKPSDSIYKFERYIEMNPVFDIDNYPFRRGDKILGDSTQSEAFIDQIVFKNFSGSITPLLFLSDIKGEFNIDDRLGVVSLEDGSISYKNERIAGSLVSIDILTNDVRTTGNEVGEIVDVRSSTGRFGKVTIEEVSKRSVGELNLSIERPGFGYTIPQLEYTMILSNAADEFETEIFLTKGAGIPEPDDEKSIRFNAGRRYYGITAVEDAGVSWKVTLDEPLERAFAQNTRVDLYRKNTVTQVYVSNQVMAVKASSLSGLTTLDIQDEFIAAARGNPVVKSQELYDFVRAYDSTGYQNGDINRDGYISVTGPSNDLDLLIKAINNTETDFDQSIVNRYSKFIFGEFEELEEIVDPNNPNMNGFVIKYEPPLVFVRSSVAEQFKEPSAPNFPTNPELEDIYTEGSVTWIFGDTAWSVINADIQRANGSTFSVKDYGTFNDSASFAVDTLYRPETVSLITDVISDYLDVRLDADDYGMSGDTQETITTTFDVAFKEENFTLGGIERFFIYDNGFDYINEAHAVAIQPTFIKFKKYDYKIKFKGEPPVLIAGDLAEQEITLFDGSSYTAKAEFLRRDRDDNFYFAHTTYYEFDDDLPLIIRARSYEISSIKYDYDSKEIGADAIVEANSTFGIGQIEKVGVTNAGYSYKDGEVVDIIAQRPALNDEGQIQFDVDGNIILNTRVIARGVAKVSGTGFTDGESQTTTSFLNEAGRVLHDNYYWQEYSYEISSQVNPEKYTDIVKNTLSVSGTKLFTSPLINTRSELVPNINIEIDTQLFDESFLVAENNIDNLVTEDPSQTPFIAVDTVDLLTIEI